MSSLTDTGSNFLRNRLEITEKVKSLSDINSNFCLNCMLSTAGDNINVGFKKAREYLK